MNEIKTSALLAQLMGASKEIGDKRNPPFTAERFLVAIIDKMSSDTNDKEDGELLAVGEIIKRVITDLNEAKTSLMKYICQDNSTSFLDDLYMKKKLQEAYGLVSKADSTEVDAVALVLCITQDPSDAIKSILKIESEKDEEDDSDSDISDEDLTAALEAKFDELFGKTGGTGSEDSTDSSKVTVERKTAIETEEKKITKTVKADMSALVSEVKRIRTELQNSIYGQDNAINVFATGYFQASMLSMIDKSRKRPRATFLFAGPPGVGKTFLAETAASALGLPFMRFDMSEYTDNLTAAQEICGYPRTYKEHKPGKATGFVSKNPKCVLLFDEIEKCCIEVIHLFLQLLDSGTLRDACLEKDISFKDVIIIMTTNAGKQLYEDESIVDLSSVSRKVVIKALQNDINPKTGVPYFPAAICSRFASGNVVMFNHISASFLRTIAQKEIERHASNLKKETGIDLQVDDKVYTALLFSEGASVDARTIRGRAETFFNDELYELLRLIASDKVKTSIDNIEKIQISADLAHAESDVFSLFEYSDPPKILVFADEATVTICKEKLPTFDIVGVQTLESSIELLKTDNIDMVMLDIRCGACQKALDSLNIEDVDSPARDFYRFIREHRNDIPIYLLERRSNRLAEEEKISFMRQGVRGVLHINKGKDSFAATVAAISTSLHQQSCMTKLAKSNKLVTFETSQTISRDGKCASIRLFDFNLTVAIDAEDVKNVFSNVSRPDVKFEDIIGANDAKSELTYFVNYLKNPQKYTGTGVKAPRGVLLYGPPGTGKTLLAKAMASEAGVTFIAAEGNQFLQPYIGEGAQKVHELFKTARRYAPAILFVDEIDAIAKERKGGEMAASRGEATLTAFLAEMDGFSTDPSKPVFVLAATNFDVQPGSDKSLDPALMRRFDRKIYIELPDKEGRIKFLKMKVSKNPALQISEQQILNLAIRSTGMSLAELDSAIELALRSAIRAESTVVTDSILEEAFETYNSGDVKKWDSSQLERVARHEAGHALLCYLSGETPSYLTIVARANHGGYMQHAEQEGKAIYTKEELLARIRTSLGGRASEIVYYGDKDGISTGASGDLSSATSIAQQIVCTYGMDDEFGLAVVHGTASANGTMSVEVRSSVNRILKEQMNEAIKLISENKDKIDSLVEELMSKNHLNGAEIEQAITRTVGAEASRITKS